MMGFTSILPVFVLVLGSPFPAQAFSLELPRSSSIDHHRTIRSADPGQMDMGMSGQMDMGMSGQMDMGMSGNVCPDGIGWKHNNGNCYYFSSHANASMVDWKTAQAKCQKLGRDKSELTIVHLAELGNPENLKSDNWLMQQISKKGHQVWLGAQDTTPGVWSMNMDPGTDDTWIWAHSKRALSVENAYWGPCQPNNHAGEEQHCLSTALAPNNCMSKRMYLNDANCNIQCHYVCQLVKTTLPESDEKKNC